MDDNCCRGQLSVERLIGGSWSCGRKRRDKSFCLVEASEGEAKAGEAGRPRDLQIFNLKGSVVEIFWSRAQL